ncbi:hypothetical protein [Thalassomonas haliotis]|uniref:Uncharacterized protein n=1 Tax=Thalassomonas haliotis TaxID=485448 RepID=A0ABY7VDZ7_9GAMM|nr:hypothetical protein [Thalassomonas haliotis]WDE11112.1 hypothetical protein H3N35_23210 [Thalassomonas haliotis]
MSESSSTVPNEAARRKAQRSALVDLSDDFYKFHQQCAFLYDAFAAVTQEPECISEETSERIRHLSYWLKYQAKGITGESANSTSKFTTTTNKPK